MMTKLLKIAAVSVNGFYRAGMFWPHAGKVIDLASLGQGVLQRLRAEPHLHITEATGDDAQAAAADALREQIKAAFAGLEATEFTEAGTPKVDAVRKALGGAKGVTAELVADLWAEVTPSVD